MPASCWCVVSGKRGGSWVGASHRYRTSLRFYFPSNASDIAVAFRSSLRRYPRNSSDMQVIICSLLSHGTQGLIVSVLHVVVLRERLRELQPRVVIAPPRDDHHPDHMAVSELVRQSFYLCGIRKYLPDVPAHRPRSLLHYVGSRSASPQIVVDVSDVFDGKMEAIQCYRSQFEGEKDSPTLRINQSYFLDSIRGHARHYGALIGVPRGEAFTSDVPLPVADLVGLFDEDPWRSR